MPCQKCPIKRGYHNWIKIGNFKAANLFYTAPAKTEDFNEDGTKLANVKIYVEEDTDQKPWIWVLDCANMEFKHYTEVSFNTGLLNLLANDKNIQAVWIIHPNMWIRGVHTFFTTFSSVKILSNVSYFDGSKLELSKSLELTGLDRSTIEWLINQ